jgi:hypothetical protein
LTIARGERAFYKNPMEIHGTAATMMVPISRATM